jgi:hypothetical protein
MQNTKIFIKQYKPMIPNETSERKRIKDYWEESTPMSFLDKKS